MELASEEEAWGDLSVLPPEVLVIILSWVPPLDVLRSVAAVNKYVHKIFLHLGCLTITRAWKALALHGGIIFAQMYAENYPLEYMAVSSLAEDELPTHDKKVSLNKCHNLTHYNVERVGDSVERKIPFNNSLSSAGHSKGKEIHGIGGIFNFQGQHRYSWAVPSPQKGRLQSLIDNSHLHVDRKANGTTKRRYCNLKGATQTCN